MYLSLKINSYVSYWNLFLSGDAHYSSKEKPNKNEPLPVSCFECNSAYDPRCGDPFDSYTIGTVNCSLKGLLPHLPDLRPQLCRKTVQFSKLCNRKPSK